MKTPMPSVQELRRILKQYLHDGPGSAWTTAWPLLFANGGSQGARHCGTRSFLLFGIAALLILLVAPPAGASENGAAHYPTGTNTIDPALMPPPGTSLWLNYITYYMADQFNNSNGDSAVPGYRVSAVAEAARLLHTWTAIDGVAWTSGIVLVANDANLDVPHRSGSGDGLGDLVIQPVLLTVAFGDLHVLGGFDVSLPTGNYNKDNLVNPGLNYTTVAPQVALTWLPTRELEFSLFSIAGFNSKNQQTHYTSGNYFDIDYAIGYRPIPSLHALEFSVVGYWLDQFTDDELNGSQYLDGHRSRVVAVGPQVRYQFTKGGFALKWLREISAENRPQGERLQLQFAVPF
jgi:hypothetical protein